MKRTVYTHVRVIQVIHVKVIRVYQSISARGQLFRYPFLKCILANTNIRNTYVNTNIGSLIPHYYTKFPYFFDIFKRIHVSDSRFSSLYTMICFQWKLFLVTSMKEWSKQIFSNFQVFPDTCYLSYDAF